MDTEFLVPFPIWLCTPSDPPTRARSGSRPCISYPLHITNHPTTFECKMRITFFLPFCRSAIWFGINLVVYLLVTPGVAPVAMVTCGSTGAGVSTWPHSCIWRLVLALGWEPQSWT